MIQIRACPRCRGDMLEERLLGEVELVCLQCGHRSYPQTVARQEAAPLRDSRPLSRAA